MKKKIFAVAVCVAALGLTACTGSGAADGAVAGNDSYYSEDDFSDDAVSSEVFNGEFAALTEYEWEYNEDDYPVGLYVSFRDNGTWESYGGGGDEGETGTFDFDGETVVLHYDNGADDAEMVLEEERKLVDWDGEVLRPTGDWSKFAEDKGPNADINYMWMYENDTTGEYDNFFAFRLDGTWFWTEDDGKTYGAEGTYDFDGKTIVLHFNDGSDDAEFTYIEEDGTMKDDSGDSLRILGPLRE